MTAKEAAVAVLKEAGEPLHTQEITDRILKRRLWTTEGKTPAATVEAQICTEMKKHGDESVFVRVAPRTYGLRELGAEPMASERVVAAGKGKEPAKGGGVTYSFTDAAEQVLKRFGDKRPMHYRDITDKALELDWLNTEGKTPEATMYAQILSEIKRYQKRGDQPRFVQHGRGYVGLRRWMGQGLAFQIEQHNRQIRKQLRKQLIDMEAAEFEELMGRLLAEMGFEDIEVTRRSSDGGIDVRGTLVVAESIRIRMAVQAKKWKGNVQAPVVQQVRGSLGTHEQGLIITTSDFSKGAREEALRPNAVPVALMNGEQLVALLAEYCIGVSRQSHDIFEIEEQETPSDEEGSQRL
jgi:restriction system protein